MAFRCRFCSMIFNNFSRLLQHYQIHDHIFQNRNKLFATEPEKMFVVVRSDSEEEELDDFIDLSKEVISVSSDDYTVSSDENVYDISPEEGDRYSEISIESISLEDDYYLVDSDSVDNDNVETDSEDWNLIRHDDVVSDSCDSDSCRDVDCDNRETSSDEYSCSSEYNWNSSDTDSEDTDSAEEQNILPEMPRPGSISGITLSSDPQMAITRDSHSTQRIEPLLLSFLKFDELLPPTNPQMPSTSGRRSKQRTRPVIPDTSGSSTLRPPSIPSIRSILHPGRPGSRRLYICERCGTAFHDPGLMHLHIDLHEMNSVM